MGDPLDIKALARRSHLLRVGGNGKKSAQCIARAAVGSKSVSVFCRVYTEVG